MRPHTILLLLCTLAVTDAGTPDCDISYIQGVAPSEFTYTYVDNFHGWRLSCTNGKAVQYNQKRFEPLYCGEKSWRIGQDVDDEFYLPVKPDEILNIQCVKACDKSFISGFEPNTMKFDEGRGNVRISCKNNGENVIFTEAGKKIMINEMACRHGADWTILRDYTRIHTTIKDIDPIAVSCGVKSDCGEFLVGLGDGVKRVNNKITCTDPAHKLKIEEGLPKTYSDLTCTPGVGWTTSVDSTTIKNADDYFGVKCGPVKCEASFVQLPANEFELGERSILRCNNDKYIEYNQRRFTRLQCDDDRGWRYAKPSYGPPKDPRENRFIVPLNPPVKGDDKLEIKCVDACHKSMINGYDTKMRYRGILDCASSSEALVYNENDKKKITDQMMCDVGEDFWAIGKKGMDAYEMSKTKTTIKDVDTLTVACEIKACHELWTSLGDGVKRDTNKLTCTNPDKEIQIDNDPAKYNELTCAKNVGWTTGGLPSQIKKDDEAFDVKCMWKPCHELWISVGEGVKRDNNKLTCTNPDKDLLIDNEPARYSDLACAKDIGWKSEGNQAQIKKDVDEFNVKCVHKPCTELLTSLGEGAKRDNNKLACINHDEKLQIDNDQTTFYNLTCTKDIGWTTDGNEAQIKKDYDQFIVKCVKQAVTEEQKGDKTAVFAVVGSITALLLIAGVVAVVVFMRKRRNAPEIKPEPTKEAAKSKDAPSSGAPSPVAPSPSGGVPSSN